MTSLGVGLVGCGAIATAVHLRVLRSLPGVKVVAVADPDRAALDAARRIVPDAARCADTAALLARGGVDAVVVTAPSGLHARIANEVLAARRHLYLEKPVACTLEEATQVADRARDAGVVAVAGFNWRFQPLFARARAIVREGTIGALRSITTSFTEPGPVPGWKALRDQGGGVLLDLGSHHFDLARWLSATEIVNVEATVRSNRSEHDEARVELTLDGGATVSSSFSLCAPRSHWIEVVGERGRLRIDRERRTLTVTGVRARTWTAGSLAWRARSLVRPRSEPSWRQALAAWIGAIRGGSRALPTLDDGVRSLEIVVAAERAAGL